MKPYGRYLLWSVVYALLYYVIGTTLFPSDHSPGQAIQVALVFGLLMRAFPFLRDLLGIGKDEPFPPFVYFVIGSGSLVVAAVWYGITRSSPSGFQLLGICYFGAYSLFYVARGVLLLRRGRAFTGGGGI